MSDRLFRRMVIGCICTWLGVLALLPLLLVMFASFLSKGQNVLFHWHVTLAQYAHLFHFVYLHIFLRSLWVAMITTLLCLLLGYPLAYMIAKAPGKRRMALLFFLIIPFWTSSLIRTYAIITIIKSQGLLNHWLMQLGLIHQPLHILYTQWASQIGLVYSLLPFMVLPLYVTLEKFDWRLLEAARDLGANSWQAFWRVLVPVSMPGVLAGVLLVLLPAMTLFYIPDILGGAKSMLLGNLIYNEFLEMRNWPMGAAISVVLTGIVVAMLFVYFKLTDKNQRQALV
jgi:spermidine/putrescine transport system permease protein